MHVAVAIATLAASFGVLEGREIEQNWRDWRGTWEMESWKSLFDDLQT